MRHLIRIDDFPHGDRNLYTQQKECYDVEVQTIIDIFERNQVDYIWGVSPLLCEERHFEALDTIHHGRIVMHGFSHGFDNVEDWHRVTECWANGGEFSFFTKDEMAAEYEKCHQLLRRFATYDPRHFIPPFNCFNQDLVDVLRTKGVQYIHSCDQEWLKYQQGQIKYRGLEPIVSELYNSYDYVDRVLSRLDGLDSQITLHWMYDIQHSGWESNYNKLAERLST
jgi:hypothetical protein